MRKKILPRKNLNNPQIKSYARAVRKGLCSQHIVPLNNGWAVKRGGATRATKVFNTQKRAILYGEKIAKNNRADLFIHKLDGRIKSRKSF